MWAAAYRLWVFNVAHCVLGDMF
jgi:hypothetical protein